MGKTIIRKSYLSIIGILLWGWIALYIPLFIRIFQIKSRKYSFDDKNLYVQEGVFHKVSTAIPLYKIENVRAHSNVLGNGTLFISSGARGSAQAGMNDLEFVKDVHYYQNRLTTVIEYAKESRGVKPVDIF